MVQIYTRSYGHAGGICPVLAHGMVTCFHVPINQTGYFPTPDIVYSQGTSVSSGSSKQTLIDELKGFGKTGPSENDPVTVAEEPVIDRS